MAEINLNNVLYMFLELSGEQDAVSWVGHCNLAAGALKALLKDIDPERRQEIEYAAACIAYFRYALKKASCEAEAFRAGDVTVRNSHGKNAGFARRLLEDALLSISDLVKDRRFKFLAV
ncbi:MAG TPA: hypothetical protein GXX17_01335 [Clostridiales bacterium]|nr:hypothetical protein [Clostridiales bacterium]